MQSLNRRSWLGIVFGAGASLLASRLVRAQAVPAASPLATVAVAPLGTFPPVLLEKIERGLRDELALEVTFLGPFSLPAEAYYPPRRRYRAERLLDFLRGRMSPPATRILGVTEVDISTTAHGVHDWGVLGLGDLGGPACVVSTYRCRRGARSRAQRDFRVVSTCIHEVGHTLGLEHCSDPSCVMTDARGSVRTVDATSGRLCRRCRARLGLQT